MRAAGLGDGVAVTSRLRIAGLVVEIDGDAGEVSDTLRELAESLRVGPGKAVDVWQRRIIVAPPVPPPPRRPTRKRARR